MILKKLDMLFLHYDHVPHDSPMCYVAKTNQFIFVVNPVLNLLCRPTEMTTVLNEAIKCGFYFLSRF